MYPTNLKKTGLAAILAVLVLAAAPAAQGADVAGMRIVRDPVTGQLRAPTAEEFKAIEAQEAKARAALEASQPSAAQPPAAPVEIRANNGAIGLRLGDSFMTYSVMKRNADGSMTLHCVTGPDAAQTILMAPPAATDTTNQEHDHANE